MNGRIYLLAATIVGAASFMMADTAYRGVSPAVVHTTMSPPNAADGWGFDVVVYGSTPAGIAAALAVRRAGHSVAILTSDDFVGGMMSAGLGYTDIGVTGSIGGLSRRFFAEVADRYRGDAAWRLETRAAFIDGLSPRFAGQFADSSMWIRFEPHVAEAIFSQWLRDAGVPVIRAGTPVSVQRHGDRIEAISGGREIAGRVFVDASYAGDLLAAAGVPYRVGREGENGFGERHAGIRRADAREHNFIVRVDPWRVPGDRRSGLLPGVEPDIPQPDGSADDRIQAYTYRLCMTDAPGNRLPVAVPADYRPDAYELLGRAYAASYAALPLKLDPLPNRKFDVNNGGAVSIDLIGGSRGYAALSPQGREALDARHRRWIEGLLHFLVTDPRVPADVRARAQALGLCRDEFVRTGGWPYQLYVREARRLDGLYTVTEDDLFGHRQPPDPAALASYQLDSHNVRRYVDPSGAVRNEGDVEERLAEPFPISVRAMLPRRGEASNLIVPVALSATHTAYGSIRMEPVFLALGESAGILAALAVQRQEAVQDVPYTVLQQGLARAGQVTDWPWYRHAFFRRKVDRVRGWLVAVRQDAAGVSPRS